MGWYEDHVFPHLLDWATRPLHRDRQQLLARASGRVLELGVGTGANLPMYTDAATEIHGIEPCEALLDRARSTALTCSNPARFQFAACGAEDMPYPDDHFDCAIACLVFCTIPDPEAAAREVRRVLRPGGRLLVLEHIRHERPGWARAQGLVQPAWKPLACGCHLNRETGTLLADAGFDTSGLERWQHPKLPTLAGFMLSGDATT